MSVGADFTGTLNIPAYDVASLDCHGSDARRPPRNGVTE